MYPLNPSEGLIVYFASKEKLEASKDVIHVLFESKQRYKKCALVLICW